MRGERVAIEEEPCPGLPGAYGKERAIVDRAVGVEQGATGLDPPPAAFDEALIVHQVENVGLPGSARRAREGRGEAPLLRMDTDVLGDVAGQRRAQRPLPLAARAHQPRARQPPRESA